MNTNSIKYLFMGGVFSINKAMAQGGTGPSLSNPLKFDSIPEVLKAIGNFIFALGIPLASVFILIGAFQFMTAGGSEERIRKGKKTLLWAIIGLMIILLTNAIISIIQDVLCDGSCT